MNLFDRQPMGRLFGESYSFIEHTLAYPPPGEGWFLFTVISKASGRSSPPDVYHRDWGPSMSVSSSTVGIWARQRTDEDRERERRVFNNPYGDDHYTRQGDYPEWLKQKNSEEK